MTIDDITLGEKDEIYKFSCPSTFLCPTNNLESPTQATEIENSIFLLLNQSTILLLFVS
jgi:hypothetical protein